MPSIRDDIRRTSINAFVAGIVFFVTVSGLSYASALVSGLSLSDKVSDWSPLSSGAWNRIVDSLLELDSRTSAITASYSGGIGLGTATPQGKVASVMANVSQHPTHFVASTPWNAVGQVSGITFAHSDGVLDSTNVGGAIYTMVAQSSPLKANMILRVNNGNNTNPQMILTGTGNVGIGTLTPDQRLSVNGSVQFCGGALGSSGKVTLSGYSAASCPAGWVTMMTQWTLSLCGKVESGCP